MIWIILTPIIFLYIIHIIMMLGIIAVAEATGYEDDKKLGQIMARNLIIAPLFLTILVISMVNKYRK